MATGTATEQLDRIEEAIKTQTQQDAVIFSSLSDTIQAFQLQVVGRLTNIQNSNNTIRDTLANIDNTLSGGIYSLLLSLTEGQQTIITILESLNFNQAQNAQNQQNITLGAAGACCDEPTLTDTVPNRLCARAQVVWDWVANSALFLCDLSDSNTLPTIEKLRDLVRNPHWSIDGKPMYTDQELVKLQGAIASRGIAFLTNLCDVRNNADLREQFISIIVQSGSSSGASNAIGNEDFSNTEPNRDVGTFIRFIAPPSVIDLAFNDTIGIGDEEKDNGACGDGGGGNEQECDEASYFFKDTGPTPSVWNLELSDLLIQVGDTVTITMHENDLGNVSQPLLYDTDPLPDVLLYDFANGPFVEFVVASGHSTTDYKLRFYEDYPEGYEGPTLYHHFTVCVNHSS